MTWWVYGLPFANHRYHRGVTKLCGAACEVFGGN